MNYGYKISTQDVNIDAGKTTELDVTLEAYGGTVTGPFGDIEFKGDSACGRALERHDAGLFRRSRGRVQQRLDLAPELAPPRGTHHLTVT